MQSHHVGGSRTDWRTAARAKVLHIAQAVTLHKRCTNQSWYHLLLVGGCGDDQQPMEGDGEVIRHAVQTTTLGSFPAGLTAPPRCMIRRRA